MLWQPVRHGLALALWGLWRLGRRRWLVGLLGLVLVGLLAWRLVGGQAGQTGENDLETILVETNASGTALGEVPPAVQAYFAALDRYDAEGLLATLSDLAPREQSADRAQRLRAWVEQARARGLRVGALTGMGLYPLLDGRTYAFVVAEFRDQEGRHEFVPYVFTLDPAGKILSVD